MYTILLHFILNVKSVSFSWLNHVKKYWSSHKFPHCALESLFWLCKFEVEQSTTNLEQAYLKNIYNIAPHTLFYFDYTLIFPLIPELQHRLVRSELFKFCGTEGSYWVSGRSVVKLCYWTLLCPNALYCSALYCTALLSKILYFSVLFYSIYFTLLYCSMLLSYQL